MPTKQAVEADLRGKGPSSVAFPASVGNLHSSHLVMQTVGDAAGLPTPSGDGAFLQHRSAHRT